MLEYLIGLNTSTLISLSLVVFLCSLLYIYKARRKIVLPDENGTIILRPTVIGALIGLTFCLPYLSLVIHAFHSCFADTLWGTGCGPEVFVCILMFPLFIYGYRNIRYFLFHKLEFDDTQVIISDLYGKKTQLAWSDFTGIDSLFFSLNPLQYYSLKTNIYNHNVDVCMVGFKVFEEYLRELNPGVGKLMQWKLYHRPTDLM